MRVIIAGGRDYRLTKADLAGLDRLLVELPITEVISGGAGRTYLRVWLRDHWEEEEWIARDNTTPFPDLRRVVPGRTVGADLCGEAWAAWRGVPCRRFVARWEVQGRGAGPKRNALMAQHADAAVLFPGGRGTASMHAEALRAGLRVIDWRGGLP